MVGVLKYTTYVLKVVVAKVLCRCVFVFVCVCVCVRENQSCWFLTYHWMPCYSTFNIMAGIL